MLDWAGIVASIVADKSFTKISSIVKRDFQNHLQAVVNTTIEKYKKHYTIPKSSADNYFFNYQDIITPLLKFSFFKEFDQQEIQTAIQRNPNITKPTEQELNTFLSIFRNNCKNDSELRKLELNENGLEIIIGKVDGLIVVVDEIKKDVKKIIPAEPKLPHALTPLPHNLTENVFGRDEDLNELKDLLSKNNTVLVVNGMGGIGKSTLAQKYVQLYKTEYNHIVYIEVPTEFETGKTIDDDTIFLSAFIEAKDNSLINNLGISFEDKTPLESKFFYVMNYLRGIDGTNLLVIDNTSDILTKYVDKFPCPPEWKVLVTSRQKIGGFTEKELEKLKPEYARELFYNHYEIERNDALLNKILEYIDRHTLTVELLAKTFNERSLKLEEALSIIEKEGIVFNKRAKITTPHSKDSNAGKHLHEHLLETFVINLDEELKTILLYFSVLPSIPVVYADLKLLFGITEENDNTFFETLNKLVKLGWLIKDTTQNTYRCHQVIQDAAKLQLQPDETNCALLIDSLTALLSLDQSKDNPVDKFKWVIFGRSTIKHFDVVKKSISTLVNNLALRLQDLGDLKEAKDLMKKALDSDIHNFGEDHSSTATRHSNLATILRDLGDLKEAKDLMKKALDSDIHNFGEDHPSTARSRSNLATILRDLGDLKEAKDLIEKVLESDIHNFGEDHPKTAIRRSILSLILQDLGDLKEAKELMKKALESDIHNFGEDHPSTAIRRSNLALILKDLGELKEAKELMKKALDSAIYNFGEDHPKTAIRRSNLATILLDLGELNEAKEQISKALQSDSKNFGEHHPKIAIRHSNLARILQDLGDLKEAKELMNKALESDIHNFGEDHPKTAIHRSNLALILKDLGDLKEAKIQAEKAYNFYKNKFGANHPNTIIVKDNLDSILEALQKQQQSPNKEQP